MRKNRRVRADKIKPLPQGFNKPYAYKMVFRTFENGQYVGIRFVLIDS